jgi:DNA-binding transcriptional ArsR family regulator
MTRIKRDVGSSPTRRRSARPRSNPIDGAAFALAQDRVLPIRYDGDAERIVESASNLTRLKMIRALFETPLAASDLARIVSRTAPATSQHIKVLRDINAIAPTRSGNVVRYHLTNEPSAHILVSIARAFDALRER